MFIGGAYTLEETIDNGISGATMRMSYSNYEDILVTHECSSSHSIFLVLIHHQNNILDRPYCKGGTQEFVTMVFH